ncbi:MAG TPA: L,D-transpeptidase family protein [Actinomycetota bacterium]|nr:L,D-transpeptidase family protein [Actinomycetota bacterium]
MGARRARSLAAGLLALAFVASGCGLRSSAQKGPDAAAMPHTTLGALVFAPRSGATGVALSQPVLVQTRYSDVKLQSVTVTVTGTGTDAASIDGTLTRQSRFRAPGPLRPDATYTVTAVVQVPQGSASPGAVRLQTETVSFSTVTTPQILAVSPTVVGPGGAAVVQLDSPARAVSVDGPATADLNADGTSVSLFPTDYHQGATFDVTLTATSEGGTKGAASSVHFSALGGPTLSLSPSPGATNMGVAYPVVIRLSEAPENPAAFAALFSVTATATVPGVSGTATATATVPTPTYAPAAAATAVNPCGTYQPPVPGAVLSVAPQWNSPTELQLVPKTADGYWPPDATIEVSAHVDGAPGKDGSWFTGSVDRTFTTGDKRVIDVDLGSQTLSACQNGTMANQFLISSGIAPKDTTATGTFYIYERDRDAEMKSGDNQFAPGYYDVKHVPWTQYFHAGDALHGAWWHNNFGHPMSHGCVNISTPTDNHQWPDAVPDAEYLWHFDNLGDPVIVHGTTPV